MIRSMSVAALALVATTTWAAPSNDKKTVCAFQGEIVGAIQQARLDRVKEAKVTETLMAANPDWPAGIADALPGVTSFVYSHSRKDLKGLDLAASTEKQCLDNWDQVQALKQDLQD